MLTQVIPSYLYLEYNDDENMQAFVDAYNELAQEYVDWFSTTYLPVWTGLSGDLLSWVGRGLYGIERPYIPSELPHYIGPYNTFAYNVLPYNGSAYVASGGFEPASDDIYKRILTWALYKGDGRQYSTTWMKRRVTRFLYGAAGVDPGVDETYNVSLQYVGGNVVRIRLIGYSDLAVSGAFAYLMNAGVLETPFQYIFDVII